MSYSRRTFDLEPLEPRLLLSGDPMLGGADVPQAPLVPPIAQAIAVQSFNSCDQAAAASAIQTPLIDLFDLPPAIPTDQAAPQDLTAPASPATAAPSATPDAAPAAEAQVFQESSEQFAGLLTCDDTAGNRPSIGKPSQASTVADQLVETLHAANGPPAGSGLLQYAAGSGDNQYTLRLNPEALSVLELVDDASWRGLVFRRPLRNSASLDHWD